MGLEPETFDNYPARLAAAFPLTKFKVGGSKEWGGTVEWTDGPSWSDVHSIGTGGVATYLSRSPSPLSLAVMVTENWLREDPSPLDLLDTDAFDMSASPSDVVAFSRLILSSCPGPDTWDLLFNVSIRRDRMNALMDNINAVGASVAAAANIDLEAHRGNDH
jgi:hypothetical protein